MRNESQSQNANLAEGGTDSRYKKIETDRGGVVGIETWEARKHLSQANFGIQESKEKVLGDGTIHVTPDFIPQSSAPMAVAAW